MHLTTRRALAGLLATAAAVAASALAGSPAADAAPVAGPTVTHTGTGPTGYTVTFRYDAPSATRVQIRGEWAFTAANGTTARPRASGRPAPSPPARSSRT